MKANRPLLSTNENQLSPELLPNRTQFLTQTTSKANPAIFPPSPMSSLIDISLKDTIRTEENLTVKNFGINSAFLRSILSLVKIVCLNIFS